MSRLLYAGLFSRQGQFHDYHVLILQLRTSIWHLERRSVRMGASVQRNAEVELNACAGLYSHVRRVWTLICAHVGLRSRQDRTYRE